MNPTTNLSDFMWRHFRGEIILRAVRLYCKCAVSYRNLEKMLCKRAIEGDRTTIYCWVQYYAPRLKNGCVGAGNVHPFRGVGVRIRRMSRSRVAGPICI
jgi:hypothetical protein